MAAKRKKGSKETVLIISGDETLLRKRALKSVMDAKEAEGWRVVRVNGTDPGAIDSAQSSFMFEEEAPLLLVVDNPEKIPLETYQEHQKTGDGSVVLLLYVEGNPKGNTKFGKWVASSMEEFHWVNKKPSTWEADSVAQEFLVAEAKSHGLALDPKYAQVIVYTAGNDLGILSFEMLKMALLAQHEGKTTIEASHVKGGIAEIAEAEVGPIADALAAKNQKKLARALGRVRKTTKGDQTIKVVRFLWASVSKWVSAANLLAMEMPYDAAASSMGANPWFFKNKVAPAAKVWGYEGLVKLTRLLANAERAVLSGHIDPWTELECKLIQACEVKG